MKTKFAIFGAALATAIGIAATVPLNLAPVAVTVCGAFAMFCITFRVLHKGVN